jgi:hypothetical protein
MLRQSPAEKSIAVPLCVTAGFLTSLRIFYFASSHSHCYRTHSPTHCRTLLAQLTHISPLIAWVSHRYGGKIRVKGCKGGTYAFILIYFLRVFRLLLSYTLSLYFNRVLNFHTLSHILPLFTIPFVVV